MSAERSLLAYTTPSESTSLPSASVLFISTVLRGNGNISFSQCCWIGHKQWYISSWHANTYFPEYRVCISSGRVAVGPTEFSARQKIAWRLSLKPWHKTEVSVSFKPGLRLHLVLCNLKYRCKQVTISICNVNTNATSIHHTKSTKSFCNTCLTVALKAPKMAAAPPQSLFIPGIVV